MSDLPEWARRLDLSPHPEGGWFKETWRSPLMMPQSSFQLQSLHLFLQGHLLVLVGAQRYLAHSL